MTQDDYDALKEFLRGVAFGSVLFIGTGVLLVLFITIGGQSETSEKKFEVVDRYKNCDVVRYTDPTQRWEYFLHCEP